jgi:hypothetical protein
MRLFITLALSLGVSEAVCSKDRLPSSAILDRGVLTQATDQGVLRVDLATGTLELSYANGRRLSDRINFVRAGSQNMLANHAFRILGGEAGAVKSGTAVCTTEAENVATAATLVSSACAGGQTSFCNSARETLSEAMTAFNDCLHLVFFPPIEDNPQPGPQQPNPNPPGGG